MEDESQLVTFKLESKDSPGALNQQNLTVKSCIEPQISDTFPANYSKSSIYMTEEKSYLPGSNLKDPKVISMELSNNSFKSSNFSPQNSEAIDDISYKKFDSIKRNLDLASTSSLQVPTIANLSLPSHNSPFTKPEESVPNANLPLPPLSNITCDYKSLASSPSTLILTDSSQIPNHSDKTKDSEVNVESNQGLVPMNTLSVNDTHNYQEVKLFGPSSRFTALENQEHFSEHLSMSSLSQDSTLCSANSKEDGDDPNSNDLPKSDVEPASSEFASCLLTDNHISSPKFGFHLYSTSEYPNSQFTSEEPSLITVQSPLPSNQFIPNNRSSPTSELEKQDFHPPQNSNFASSLALNTEHKFANTDKDDFSTYQTKSESSLGRKGLEFNLDMLMESEEIGFENNNVSVQPESSVDLEIIPDSIKHNIESEGNSDYAHENEMGKFDTKSKPTSEIDQANETMKLDTKLKGTFENNQPNDSESSSTVIVEQVSSILPSAKEKGIGIILNFPNDKSMMEEIRFSPKNEEVKFDFEDSPSKEGDSEKIVKDVEVESSCETPIIKDVEVDSSCKTPVIKNEVDSSCETSIIKDVERDSSCEPATSSCSEIQLQTTNILKTLTQSQEMNNSIQNSNNLKQSPNDTPKVDNFEQNIKINENIENFESLKLNKTFENENSPYSIERLIDCPVQINSISNIENLKESKNDKELNLASKIDDSLYQRENLPEHFLLSASSENIETHKLCIPEEDSKAMVMTFIKKQPNEVSEQLQDDHISSTVLLSPLKKDNSSEICKDEFNWDSFLEETGSETTPPTAFLHVENSLETGVKEGQCLEILEPSEDIKMNENKLIEDIKENEYWSSYWPAKVISSCGNLLRIRLLGFLLTKSSTMTEIWCDLSNNNIKPLGWAAEKDIPMVLPPSLSSLPQSPNIDIEKELLKSGSVPEEAFSEKTRQIFARIQEGHLLEVISSDCPDQGIIVRVRENYGGRLLLQDILNETDTFWLFLFESRIKPLGWIKQQENFRYRSEKYLQHLEDRSNQPSLPFFMTFQTLHTPHSLQPGMQLEAILPTTCQSIHVGFVSRIINEIHFEVSVGDQHWVSTVDDPLLLPFNFCQDHFMDLILHPENEGLAREGVVGMDLFPERSLASEAGFEEGHKIETVSPLDPSKIGVATIERIVGHLLLLKLDVEPSYLFYRPSSSMEVFPAGWAQSNGLPLLFPANIIALESDAHGLQKDSTPVMSSEDSSQTVPDTTRSEKSNGNSMWCQKLYINHFCYPGPYLSKTKIAKMSQSVGPGPALLVLRDVIGMTINSGYTPTRVLRELQNLHVMDPSWHPVSLKAKFKRHILKASVNIPSTAKELEFFLREFSKILMCCPNLWSHTSIGENCPLVCNRQNQLSIPSGIAAFRGRGIRGYSWKKKRGSKKRLFYPMKTSATNQDDGVDRASREGDEEYYCEADDGFEGEEGLSGSEGESRPSSPPCSDGPRKMKQKRMLSALEITMNEARVLDFTRDRGSKRTRRETDTSLNPSPARDGSPSRRKKPRPEDEPQNAIYGLEPADVTSDPLEWSVADVERYVANQPAICHHAVRLREQEVDGRALLLLNLPSLVHHLRLPHGAAVSLAQQICKVKMAHFLYFHPDRGQRK